jgi:hypothetical protein
MLTKLGNIILARSLSPQQFNLIVYVGVLVGLKTLELEGRLFGENASKSEYRELRRERPHLAQQLASVAKFLESLGGSEAVADARRFKEACSRLARSV